MQKTIEKKQTWKNVAENNGTVIGNAQIGSVSSETVIGNAVIGGVTVGVPNAAGVAANSNVANGGAAAGVAANSGSVMTAQVLGNASVSTGIVGNAVIEIPKWQK